TLSQAANLNPQQVQDLTSQAQDLAAKQMKDLVDLISSFSAPLSAGNNPLTLSPEDQKNLVAQTLKDMLQNQQVLLAGVQSFTLPANAVATQTFFAEDAVSLQVSLTDMGSKGTSLSLNLQTLELQLSQTAISMKDSTTPVVPTDS